MKILKLKKKFKLFITRFRVCWKILTNKHVVVIYLTRNDFVELVKDNSISSTTHISYLGMLEFQALKTIKETANKINEVDLICNKANFEVEVEESLQNKLL